MLSQSWSVQVLYFTVRTDYYTRQLMNSTEQSFSFEKLIEFMLSIPSYHLTKVPVGLSADLHI